MSYTSPKDSIELGVGMIHQHFKLVDVLTAEDNIVIGQKKQKTKGKDLTKEIKELSDKYGLDVNPHKSIRHVRQ